MRVEVVDLGGQPVTEAYVELVQPDEAEPFAVDDAVQSLRGDDLGVRQRVRRWSIGVGRSARPCLSR